MRENARQSLKKTAQICLICMPTCICNANEKQGLIVKISSYQKSASGITAFMTGKTSKIVHCLGLFDPFFRSILAVFV